MTWEIAFGLLGAVGIITAAFQALGRERQRLVELRGKHEELAKECRERLSAVEGRANSSERWQAAVSERLEGITSILLELKAAAAPRKR